MTAEQQDRRKPGRPRKYGEGRVNATVRFTPERYAKLKEQADQHRRSVSEEVEARIERSFFEEGLADIRRGVDQVGQDIQQMWQELFEKAMARIEQLQAVQPLTEEQVERAVTRALAKAHLVGQTIDGGDET